MESCLSVPTKPLDMLQNVQNSAARVLTHTKPWQQYIFFQCSLCLWDAASKSLVLSGTGDVTGSRKNYKLFAPHLSPHTLGDQVPCLFERIFWFWQEKKACIIECDAMHPGKCMPGLQTATKWSHFTTIFLRPCK